MSVDCDFFQSADAKRLTKWPVDVVTVTYNHESLLTRGFSAPLSTFPENASLESRFRLQSIHEESCTS